MEGVLGNGTGRSGAGSDNGTAQRARSAVLVILDVVVAFGDF